MKVDDPTDLLNGMPDDAPPLAFPHSSQIERSGNLFVLPGPKLIMLDFGLCRKLDDKFRLGYARLVNAMLSSNVAGMIQGFLDLGVKVKRAEDTRTYIELGRSIMETSRPGQAYADPDLVAEANQRMSRAIRANPITDIPREFLLIGRVMGLLSEKDPAEKEPRRELVAV